MNYILFDDTTVRNNLLPLTFTRPVAEIRVGILTIREKWEHYLNTKTSSKTENYLAEKFPLHFASENIFINGALFPTIELLNEIKTLKSKEALYSGEQLLAYNTGNTEIDNIDIKTFITTLSKTKINGINNLWDIFSMNGMAIQNDFTLLTKGRKSATISATNKVMAAENIFVEDGAIVECAILNATSGPIYIGKNAEIMEGSIVRGPLALCEGSALKLGAKIYGPTTIGPHSKVGGEVNNSVIFGYSNKGHDGFLGNAVLGEWCNIGADSNNSNLKNNYAEVKLWNYTAERFVKTGLTFCGLIMADHAKCGINTMFNTGTVVGVNANIFGAGFPRNFVPDFAWGGAHGFTTYKLSDAFEVAEKVMERRHIEFTEADKKILNHVFELTEKHRKTFTA